MVDNCLRLRPRLMASFGSIHHAAWPKLIRVEIIASERDQLLRVVADAGVEALQREGVDWAKRLWKISRMCSIRYRYSRYRSGYHTELTEVSGTGIDVVRNLPKCLVPVLISYRSYQSVRYRYWCCTELTEVSGTGMKVCTGTGGAGIHIVPNLPKCPVPVLMSYRTYRSARYR